MSPGIESPHLRFRRQGPHVDARPVSRILYGAAAVDGHSSRPAIAGRLKRPTRKFGAPSRHAYRWLAPSVFLPYLVLLRVGFAMPRTLLPGRCALTAPFHPYLALADVAVFSLWHFPSGALQGTPTHKTRACRGPRERAIPDVIRHAALRSSDFPLSSRAAQATACRSREDSDHPVRHQLPLL